MNCTLDNIKHSKMKTNFKTTLLFCPLFKKDTGSMIHTGLLCSGCCLRIQMVCEALADLILRDEVSAKDLKIDPKCFFHYLAGDLREYAEVVSNKTGKSWKEISDECSHCDPTEFSPMEITDAEPTEMTMIGQND